MLTVMQKVCGHAVIRRAGLVQSIVFVGIVGIVVIVVRLGVGLGASAAGADSGRRFPSHCSLRTPGRRRGSRCGLFLGRYLGRYLGRLSHSFAHFGAHFGAIKPLYSLFSQARACGRIRRTDNAAKLSVTYRLSKFAANSWYSMHWQCVATNSGQ